MCKQQSTKYNKGSIYKVVRLNVSLANSVVPSVYVTPIFARYDRVKLLKMKCFMFSLTTCFFFLLASQCYTFPTINDEYLYRVIYQQLPFHIIRLYNKIKDYKLFMQF